MVYIVFIKLINNSNMRPVYYWLILFSIIFPLYIGIGGYYVKINYFDEKEHFKESMCKINNCTSYMSTCCGEGVNSCYVCYNILLEYELLLNNITKNGSGVFTDKNICSLNSINCYYDDRDIKNSLRLWNPYQINNSYNGLLIFGLIMLLIIYIMILQEVHKITHCKCKPSDNIKHNEYEPLMKQRHDFIL